LLYRGNWKALSNQNLLINFETGNNSQLFNGVRIIDVTIAQTLYVKLKKLSFIILF